MQLTEHFSLAELTDSDTAVRLGIDNTPPDTLMDNLRRTAEMGEVIRGILCEVARKEIIVTINSGYRCEALERAICWKDLSKIKSFLIVKLYKAIHPCLALLAGELVNTHCIRVHCAPHSSRLFCTSLS